MTIRCESRIIFGHAPGSKGQNTKKKCNYGYILKHLSMKLCICSIGRRIKYITLFWIWPPVHAPDGRDFGPQGSKRKKKIQLKIWYWVIPGGTFKPSFNFAFGGKHGNLQWHPIDFALVTSAAEGGWRLYFHLWLFCLFVCEQDIKVVARFRQNLVGKFGVW